MYQQIVYFNNTIHIHNIKNPFIFDRVKCKGDLNLIIHREINYENIFIYNQVIMDDLLRFKTSTFNTHTEHSNND